MASVAIVGSRRVTKAVLEQVVAYVRRLPQGTVVVSGGARGIDTAALEAAKEAGLETLDISPDWKEHGYSAGFIRNTEIVRKADRVVAFWDGVSRGTAHTISVAKRTGKLEKVFRFSRLVAFTARMGCKDPDVLDITRKSGQGGLAFAPSWELLGPILARRRAGEDDSELWPEYVEGYLREMRRSYRENAGAWTDLLNRKRVVLMCYCTNPERCHRTLFARQVLGPLGVTYGGEIATPPPPSTKNEGGTWRRRLGRHEEPF